jgi:hypothetical protein
MTFFGEAGAEIVNRSYPIASAICGPLAPSWRRSMART